MKRCLAAAAWLFAANALAAISVQDDAGNTVVLEKPAQRVVSIAPHTTEMLFAAGGGERIVGTVSYSDYPPAAKSIPRIGDMRQIDLERVAALKPDLLVAWLHNSSARQRDQLKKLGVPLYYSEPRRLDDVPATLLRLGRLLGAEQAAEQSASEVRRRLAALEAQYRNRPRVRVFYQVWDSPLYTLNGQHMINDVLRLCGGENVFAGLAAPAPVVTVEAVLWEDPEAIASGERNDGAGRLEHWKQYPRMLAVRRRNLFGIDGDLLNRPGPRIVAGAEALCEKLELARSRRQVQQEEPR